jgi:hypothetical protein
MRQFESSRRVVDRKTGMQVRLGADCRIVASITVTQCVRHLTAVDRRMVASVDVWLVRHWQR